MLDRICITGIGVVSSIGIGKEEFLSSLKGGDQALKRLKGSIPISPVPRKQEWSGRFSLRSSSQPTSSGASIGEPICHRCFENGSRRCTIFRHPGKQPKGGNRSRFRFLWTLQLRGVPPGAGSERFLDLNPILFPNTVPNAASVMSPLSWEFRGQFYPGSVFLYG
jgi:hypothetical protein